MENILVNLNTHTWDTLDSDSYHFYVNLYWKQGNKLYEQNVMQLLTAKMIAAKQSRGEPFTDRLKVGDLTGQFNTEQQAIKAGITFIRNYFYNNDIDSLTIKHNQTGDILYTNRVQERVIKTPTRKHTIES